MTKTSNGFLTAPSKVVKTAWLGLGSFAILATMSAVAQATVVSIVDSGVDVQHKALEASIWKNPNEIAGNGLDDDGNTFVDDVFGWNFAENNNKVIDLKYLERLTPDNLRFFELQKKSLEGKITPEEREWVKAKLADPKFLKGLQTFGNFVHGTHVAGIAANQGTSGVDILAVKLLPTEVKLPGLGSETGNDTPPPVVVPGPNLGDFLLDLAFKQVLNQLAKAQGQIFASVGSYMNNTRSDVANLSLGTSTLAAKNIVAPLAKIFFGKKPPSDEKLTQYAAHLVQGMVKETTKMALTSPKTLFVIAAGNDGSNNDELPVAPANMSQPNSISVAATFGNESLAPFSNYGSKMVDVAAPGVGILSTIPGGGEMYLSGTSQASPKVAQVAGVVLQEDSSLTPEMVKEILMKTSDQKAFLQSKVRSGGIVNSARALEAAKLTRQGLSVAEAIAKARVNVADAPSTSGFSVRGRAQENDTAASPFVLPLPSTL